MRFPEFEDEWQQTTLGEVCQIVGGGTPSTEIDKYWGGNIPWFTPSEIQKKYIGHSERTITEEGLNNSGARLLPKGAILLTTRATIGECSISMIPCCTNQGFQSLIVNPHKSTTEFIYQKVQTLRNELLIRANGSTFKEITAQEVRGIHISIPTLEEQRKIAEFLSLIDERIEAQRQTIEERKKQKKALLNQLFSQSLRFPAFSEPWTQTTLGKIGEIRMCKRILANQTNSEGGIPFFKIGTIGKKEDSYISETLFQEYKSKYHYPNKGQILITCAGTIGRCLIFDGNDAYYQDSNIVWIDNDESCITNPYLYYLLYSTDWSKLNTSTIVRLYNDDLRALPMSFSSSLKEQEKITEFLSLIDNRIEVEEELLQKYEEQKKYLLRQMFV